MKFSEAMLKGYKQVDGKQCFLGWSARTEKDGGYESLCALGAINVGFGRPAEAGYVPNFNQRFEKAWGIRPHWLNDSGMPWEHIYGMAVAAGL